MAFWTTLLPESALLGSATTVGDGLIEDEQFDEARPWFERAAAVLEKGDVDGWVDAESLELTLDALAAARRQVSSGGPVARRLDS
jgi:hypothetical protein